MMNKKIFLTGIAALALCAAASAPGLRLNEFEVLEENGVSVLVYSNQYNGMFCDEKTAGVELIQHGERIATGGGIRLMDTPEQWDIYPDILKRDVDRARQSVDMTFEIARSEERRVG